MSSFVSSLFIPFITSIREYTEDAYYDRYHGHPDPTKNHTTQVHSAGNVRLLPGAIGESESKRVKRVQPVTDGGAVALSLYRREGLGTCIRFVGSS